MNSFPIIKELNIKLNKLKSNQKVLNAIKNINENKFIKELKERNTFNYILKRKKYIIPSTIIIFSGSFIYLSSLNKNTAITENYSSSLVANDPLIIESEENNNEELKNVKNELNNNEELNIVQSEQNNNDDLKNVQIDVNNNEELNISQSKKNNNEILKSKEESPIDLLSPLISPLELDSEIPKGRNDPFNKFNTVNDLPLNNSNTDYLDITIYGIIAAQDRIYALTRSQIGSALICSNGRGKCDEFSSNVLPLGWEVNGIDIKTGCALFINKKSSEKSICMSSL